MTANRKSACIILTVYLKPFLEWLPFVLKIKTEFLSKAFCLCGLASADLSCNTPLSLRPPPQWLTCGRALGGLADCCSCPQRSGLSRSGFRPGKGISDTFPRDAEAAGLRTTLSTPPPTTFLSNLEPLYRGWQTFSYKEPGGKYLGLCSAFGLFHIYIALPAQLCLRSSKAAKDNTE